MGLAVELVDLHFLVEVAGLAISAMVVELLLVEQNWFPRLLQNMREGILD
jgi:hypothetical protein